MRRKFRGINRGCFQNKVDLVVNNYLLCNKIKLLCNNANCQTNFNETNITGQPRV